MAKILAIHDDPGTLDTFSSLLKNNIPQCQFITAPSGSDGLQKAISEHPDTILLDAGISGTDGFEICKQLKSEQTTKHIPVVILIDNETVEKNRMEEMALGVGTFLRKPVDEVELVTQISAMLRVKEAEDILRREKDLLEGLVKERTHALHVNEARYKGIFENTINGVAVYQAVDDGEDFIFVDFNRTGEKIDNVKREDLIGKKVTEVFPGVKTFGLFEVFQRVWKTGNPEHYPIAMYQDKRISGWRDNFVYKLPYGEIVAIYSDETERKKYEQELQESEETYRMLFEHAGFGIALVDPDTSKREAFNRNLYERLGYTPEEYKDLTIADIQYDQGPEEVKKRMRMILEKGSFTFEEKHRTKHGEIRHVLVSAVPIRIHGRQLIQTISLDITDQKESEKAFQAILESTVGIIGQDFFDKIVKEICDWLNCEIAFIVEIDAALICHPVSMIVDGHISTAFSFNLIGTPCHDVFLNGFRYYPEGVCNQRPEDTRLLEMGAVGYVGTPLIDGAGNRIGVLGAISRKKFNLPERAEDVMKILAARVSAEIERKKVEREKIQVEAQLQQAQKMEAIGTLAGGIAHDFNNILQSIILNTELALYERSSTEGPDRMEEVLKASRRATDLVKQILTFSRQSESELQPLHIDLIIKEALKMLRSSLPTTIEIRKKVSSKADLVIADVTQIHQVIMNLCTNAGHAMRDKGGVLNVILRPEDIGPEITALNPDLSPGPYLRLIVSDTGHGMAPETIRRIFDPFFTTKERGEGTGLGLSVVYGIIKNLGGAITIESEVGKGTTFSIFLPRLQKESIPMPEEIRPLPKGNERILLIDDEVDLIKVECGVLEKLGYQMVTTSNSMEGLDIFRSQPDSFELVITDQTMPKMPGSELAKELIRIRPDIPIILCTGHSAMVSEEKARSLGIRAFAMKPFEMREIAETIRKVLD